MMPCATASLCVPLHCHHAACWDPSKAAHVTTGWSLQSAAGRRPARSSLLCWLLQEASTLHDLHVSCIKCVCIRLVRRIPS